MYANTASVQNEITGLRKEVAKLREERDKLRKEVTKLQNKVDDRDIIILMMYNELDETAKDLDILGRANMCLSMMLAVKIDEKSKKG